MRKCTLLLLLVAASVLAQTDSLQLKGTQDAVHLREIPRNNLILDLGITQPTASYGDIARSGLQIGAEFSYYTDKHLGLGISLRHQNNQFGFLDFQMTQQMNRHQVLI